MAPYCTLYFHSQLDVNAAGRPSCLLSSWEYTERSLRSHVPLLFPAKLLAAPPVKQGHWERSREAAVTYHGHHRPRVHVLHQPRVEGAVFQVNVVLLQEVLGGLPPRGGTISD